MKRNVSVQLPKETLDEIRRRADSEGVSVSDIIRRLLRIGIQSGKALTTTK